MKYTASELVAYCKENGLMEGLSEALRVNDKGYRLLRIEGSVRQLSQKEFLFQANELHEGKPILECGFANFPWQRFVRTDRITAYTVFFGEQVYFLDFLAAEEDGLKTMELVYEDFLTKLSIDTRGKLKKLLSDSFEII